MAGPTAPHQDGLLAGRSGHASRLCCSRLCPVTGRRAARLAPCAQFRGTQPRPVHRRLPFCVTQAHSGVTETLWPRRVDVCQPDTVRKLDPHGPPWAAQVPAAQGPRSLRPPRPREAQLGLLQLTGGGGPAGESSRVGFALALLPPPGWTVGARAGRAAAGNAAPGGSASSSVGRAWRRVPF